MYVLLLLNQFCAQTILRATGPKKTCRREKKIIISNFILWTKMHFLFLANQGFGQNNRKVKRKQAYAILKNHETTTVVLVSRNAIKLQVPFSSPPLPNRHVVCWFKEKFKFSIGYFKCYQLTNLTKPNPLSLLTKTSATSPNFSNIPLSSVSSQLTKFPTKSRQRPENFLSLGLLLPELQFVELFDAGDSEGFR